MTRLPTSVVGKRCIIVIPAHNEESTVGDVIEGARFRFNGEVLVVDDGSSDETASISREAGARVIEMPFALGAWGAVQTGVEFALERGYEMCLTMDADGQHVAAALDKVAQPVALGDCDVAIGVCPERASVLRRLAWLVFRRMTGLQLKDLTSGFRAYNLDAMRVLASREASMLSYQDVGVLLMLREAGLRAVEVEVDMRPRTNGKSRVYHSWPTVGKYLMETALLCVGKWRPSWHVGEMFVDHNRPDR